MGTVVNSMTGTVSGLVIQAGNLPTVVSSGVGTSVVTDDVVEISGAERTEIVEMLNLLGELNTRRSGRAEELADALRNR
ncbi:hypothetical protein [Streptomyces sp. NPDC051546]|uniref:hypothetical protein n=1 Tax=Streptomyces sp. NPDC051546 TaxID=3365655 RepID=UPI0037B8EF9E